MKIFTSGEPEKDEIKEEEELLRQAIDLSDENENNEEEILR